MTFTREASIKMLVKRQVERLAGKGLKQALRFLEARVRETMNVLAAGPATPGAPIRRVSGRARASVWSKVVGPTSAAIGASAVSKSGFPYPMHHERKDHPFIKPTVKRYSKELKRIIGRSMRAS